MHRPLLLLHPLPAAALAAALAAQPPQGARGTDTLRIDSEMKLDVPRADVGRVWQHLSQRYADASWLDRDGHRFHATFGDEVFVDVYFDTPGLTLLATRSGVRHRTRSITEGATAKDGRQLLQIKLNAPDAEGMQRGEIKYEVSRVPRPRSPEEGHPMLGLLDHIQRDECKARFLELGIDPMALRPVLTVRQQRQRVYLNDQDGPLATLTLDQASVPDWGLQDAFTEVELELNEIRYTEADARTRAWMEELRAGLRADLQRAFPDLVQDQAPKYQKAFALVEAANWLPLRTLIGWSLRPRDLFAILAVFGLLLAGGAVHLWVRRRARLRAA